MGALRAVFLGFLVIAGPCASFGQKVNDSRTTTTLSLQATEEVVRAGVVVKLTAKISSVLSLISRGQVRFCDADAARCDGLAIVGVAQVNPNGSATLTLTLGPGNYHFRALFCGTPRSDPPASASNSSIQAISIKGTASIADGGGELI
jgi:hypothetical protein